MDFLYTIKHLFDDCEYSRCHSTTIHGTDIKEKGIYMTVPLAGNRIEIPILALNVFNRLTLKQNLPNELVIRLYSVNSVVPYKSFNKIMEVALEESFKTSRLVEVEGKDGNNRVTYYVTKGALFDKDFKPLAICSWILEKKPYKPDMKEMELRWHFTEPILRIDPEFYLRKPDNMGRYFLKKIVPALLQTYVWTPRDCHDYICQYGNTPMRFSPKIEIAKCPFNSRRVNKPSIMTTNDTLIDTVLDNLEDFKCR